MATVLTTPQTSIPDASQPLIFFFIVTSIYAIIRYHTSKISLDIDSPNIVVKETNFMWTIIYILFLVLGNYFINLNITTVVCGTTQWTKTLVITLVPWLLIFGVITLLLLILPGWLSPFSNTIGYGIAKFLGLDAVINDILKPKALIDDGKTQETTGDQRLVSENLQMIYSDRSLLINEISPDNFNSFWKNMATGGLITNDARNSTTLRNALFNFVMLKNVVSEYIWYLLTGALVTSVGYNYIVNSSCTRSVAQMEATHTAYTQLQTQQHVTSEADVANAHIYNLTS